MDYHLQTNEQAERHTAAFASWPGHYIAEYQQECESYVMPLAYAYNVPNHLSEKLTLFSLVVGRH